MKALAYAFSAENPHALRNILLVAVTIAYLVVIVVLFLRLRHANQKMADRMKELSKQKQAEQAAKEVYQSLLMPWKRITYLPSTHRRNTY